MKYVIGLGTNLGERKQNLEDALVSLERLPDTAVIARSSVYETEPVGYADQPDFLNMVAVVESSLSPRAMLGGCLGIEATLGRVRSFRNGPRVIDLDLLLAEGYSEKTPELTVPHPRMTERAFVMDPLSELESRGVLTDFDIPAPSFKKISKKLKKSEKRA